MIFFSGFCLNNEKELFNKYLIDNEFTIAGFSYGAIKAIKYALESKDRIDLIQLFSPAFFLDKDDSFKKKQLLLFKKKQDIYLKSFFNNILYPSKIDIKPFVSKGSLDELQELLYYKWDDLDKLKNIKIESYFGEYDKIINPLEGFEFFSKYGDSYFIKGVGHILQ